MSDKKPTLMHLANQLEEHARTAEIIFGKHCRSETERQAAVELRRQADLIHEIVVAVRTLRLASGDDETIAAYKAARAAIKRAEDV